jgi:hypothetical protein
VSPATPPRTEREHGRDSSGVANPAGRDHRHRRYGVDHRRDQRQRRDGTQHVPAGLPALGNDHIDSTADCASRLLGTCHRVQHETSGIMQTANVGRWVAPVNETMRSPASGASGRRALLIPGENEIPTEGAICQRFCLDDHRSDVSDPGPTISSSLLAPADSASRARQAA